MKKLMITAVMIVAAMGAGACETNEIANANPNEVKLTVYNGNFAIVTDVRDITFNKGINEIKFTNIPSAIDPTTVKFQCENEPKAVTILEQNYEYDLVSIDSLLKRYIDKKVEVTVKGSGSDNAYQTNGELLAAVGNEIILKKMDGQVDIIAKQNIERIELKEMASDLVTKPTLIWLANAKKAGTKKCQTTYSTDRVNWKADYTAVIAADDKSLDLTGWVTIDNKSGAGYKNAKIKLIAGDVNKIRPRSNYGRRHQYKNMMPTSAEADGGFEEKAFMEYHMYTLGRRSTVGNNQTKQIEFIEPVLNVPAKKVYLYDRTQYNDKIQVKIEFQNEKEYGLGMALPKGKIRVFKKDPADGSAEFVGEDMIDHTAKKQKLSLYIGNAFDLPVKTKIVDSQSQRRSRTDVYEVELKNRKNEAVEIFVDEKFGSHVNWRVVDSSVPFEKLDSKTARFKVKVEADKIVILKYTTIQNW